MRVDDLIEQFNLFYAQENQIDELKRFSNKVHKDIYEKFQSANENEIQTKSGTYLVPEVIIENKEKSPIMIDSCTNNSKDVFLLDTKEDRFFQIHKEVDIEPYQLQMNESLHLKFNYESDNDVNFNLVIIEYHDGKGINSRKYTMPMNIEYVPHQEAESFKIFIEPEETVFLYNVDFEVVKKEMPVVNKFHFKMNNESLYKPIEDIVIKESEQTTIEFPETDRDFIYLSYGIDNNSFNKVPEESLIKIDPANLYQLTANFSINPDIEVIPTIIEYNDEEKTNLIKLTNKPEFIKFQKDTKFIRFSYRFSGHGIVQLSDLLINEFKSQTEYLPIDWKSRYEIDRYMRTISSTKELRIAAIMDEFTFHSYKSEANIHRLSFENWKNEILSFMPHMIFIESSWHGNNEEWTKKIAYVTEEKHNDIKKLINFSKSNDIPVVFWNKEDPVHYAHFLETAKLCDFVFTTDRNKIDDYKRDCGHDNVDVLQFAAQPSIHNPIKIQKERENAVSFAGSYYSLREERSKDMDRLFRAAIPHNLVIYDRNYEHTKKGERLNFLFPEEFRKYIIGTLPFYKIDKAYKGFKYMININTVKESPTMYARRVFEGLASGTPIISNYSFGMENQFGDIIASMENEEELSKYLDKLNNSESEYNKIKQLGIRRVLSEHTYKHRLLQISKEIGYQYKLEETRVTGIGFAKNQTELEKIIKHSESIDYPYLKMIIFTLFEIDDYSKLDRSLTVLNLDRALEHFDTISDLVDCDYLMPLKDNDYYGKEYLNDLLLAAGYTDAEIIGKQEHYVLKNNHLTIKYSGNHHEYCDDFSIYSSIISSQVFNNLDLEESIEYLTGNKRAKDLSFKGIRLFSNDRMNYIENGSDCNEEILNEVSI